MVKFVSFDDENATEEELEVYNLVLEVTARYNIDPSSSVEAEKFFSELLTQYNGDLENLTNWLDQQIRFHFKVLNKWPKWVQNPQWVYVKGKPAIFVDQIDVNTRNSNLASQIFHDDVSFYLFIDEEGTTTVIMQQF